VLVRAHGFAIQRGVAEHAIVELDVRPGLPAFSVIGLTGGAARDARERVQAALLNSGLSVPRKRVTVNLAPASGRRSGSEFDLAIACCVVAADGLVDPARLARVGLFGELGLGGLLRPCVGASAVAAAAAEARLEKLIVALPDLAEARSARALPVAGRLQLSDVVALLAAGERQLPERPIDHGPHAPARRATRQGASRRIDANEGASAPRSDVPARAGPEPSQNGTMPVRRPRPPVRTAGGPVQVDGTPIQAADGAARVDAPRAAVGAGSGRGDGAELRRAGDRRGRPP
jgi:hypothetical protein